MDQTRMRLAIAQVAKLQSQQNERAREDEVERRESQREEREFRKAEAKGDTFIGEISPGMQKVYDAWQEKTSDHAWKLVEDCP